MESLSFNFEKELKIKLLYKTSPHMTEEILLFRTFKYFDVDNSDHCDLNTFLKVIAKVGLLEFSENELSSLFYFYSNNQKLLNYKDFIGIIFNNESLKKNKHCVQEKYTPPPQNQPLPPQDAPAQVENNEEVDPIEEYILRIRKKLSTKGLPNLINMESTFRVMDENNEQEVDFNQFCQICQDYDFGLNQDEIKELFMDFDRDGVGKINYDDFIRVMRGELNEKRKDLVRNLFQTLDKEQKGFLTLDELFSLYNPLESFECKFLNFSPEESMKYFVNTFSGNHKYLNGDEGVNKPADIDEFEDYYESVSIMIPDDNIFRDILLGSWGLIKEEDRQEEANVDQNLPPEHGQPQYEQEQPQQQYEQPQQQYEQPQQQYEQPQQQYEQPQQQYEQPQQQYEQPQQQYEQPQQQYEQPQQQYEQPQQQYEQPQQQYEQQPPQVEEPEQQPSYYPQEQEYPPEPEIPQRQDIVYAQMKKDKEFRKNLFNEENMDYFRNQLGARGIVTVMNFVNQLRQYDRKGNKELSFNDFNDAVNNINLNLTPDDIKDLFNDFADPKTQNLNYANFLNALVGDLNNRRQNIVNVAYKKLDNENCGVINLSDVKEQFNSKNSPLVRDAIMSEEMFFNSFMDTFQTHHNIYRSPKIKKVNFAEFEDYYKYVSITIDDDYLFEEMIIAAWKLSKTRAAYVGPKDTVKQLISHQNIENNNNSDFKPSLRVFPRKDKVPFGVDDEVTDYSNQLHPKGNLNGIKLNKIDDPLSDFRRKVIVRGPRCVMSMRRTFMLYDINKNDKLSFDEFKKFIRDYRFNLNAEEQTKLFKLFDKNNTGDIDYTEFIHAIFGKMNNFRRQVVQRVFEKLDSEKTGKVPFEVIRNSYNADKHPEVLNGNRTQPEILSRFIDLFEYHFNILNQNKNNDYATMDEFLEFYDYLSAFIDDDKYFENLMSRVWELGATENYTRSFKCITRRKMF